MDMNVRHFPSVCSLDLSVVIAVYNEQDVIVDLLSRLYSILEAVNISYEILVVDDGSTDRTLSVLRAHVGKRSGLRVIELHRNVDQVAAISAAMSVANGMWILMMDGDLQHDPADIPRFLAERWDSIDLVASYREKREETVGRKVITA